MPTGYLIRKKIIKNKKVNLPYYHRLSLFLPVQTFDVVFLSISFAWSKKVLIGILLKKTWEGKESAFSKLYSVLFYCSKGRWCVGRYRQIVKSDNTYIFRHFIAKLVALSYWCGCNTIMAADYSSPFRLPKILVDAFLYTQTDSKNSLCSRV